MQLSNGIELNELRYLSYSSMSLFYKDPELFYQQYLYGVRGVRQPQTAPMAIGSAFDARVKSYLHEKLVGKSPDFELNTIFEKQVEVHARDLAWADSKEVFDQYVACGALAYLLRDLAGCVGTPRFESEIHGLIKTQVGDVPILGRPDIYFITKMGARVIFDWKVNGFYSANAPSPKPGYVRMWPGGAGHKNALPKMFKGILINGASGLESTDTEWATQTSAYAWLLGEPVGSDFIAVIDQLICKDRVIRVARHSANISETFQRKILDKFSTAWDAIKRGHVFLSMTYEDNLARIKTLHDILSLGQTVPDDIAALVRTKPSFR